MDPITFAGLMVLGACTGVLAGLMGIGGGMIMVPFLLIALRGQGIDDADLIKVAIATSLTTILFTSVSSVRSHHKRGAVLWNFVVRMAPGIVLGTLLASQLMRMAPGQAVTLFFAGFLVWSSLQMMRAKGPARTGQGIVQTIPRPRTALLAAVGTAIGLLSAMVGAGGGFMTLPTLARWGVPVPNAVATSAACGFPIAAAGALGYAIAGQGMDLPGPMLGLIHLPALLAISLTSVLTAPLGARLAHQLPTHILKRGLAVGLLIMAVYMAYQAFTI